MCVCAKTVRCNLEKIISYYFLQLNATRAEQTRAKKVGHADATRCVSITVVSSRKTRHALDTFLTNVFTVPYKLGEKKSLDRRRVSTLPVVVGHREAFVIPRLSR